MRIFIDACGAPHRSSRLELGIDIALFATYEIPTVRDSRFDFVRCRGSLRVLPPYARSNLVRQDDHSISLSAAGERYDVRPFARTEAYDD
jgi:hypothetical protein